MELASGPARSTAAAVAFALTGWLGSFALLHRFNVGSLGVQVLVAVLLFVAVLVGYLIAATRRLERERDNCKEAMFVVQKRIAAAMRVREVADRASVELSNPSLGGAEDTTRVRRYANLALRALVDAAVTKIDELLDQAGAKARQLEQALVARIQAYLRELIDGALATVRESPQIGGLAVQLARVDISQRIALGGSLKASIQEICAITATGELTINAEYTTAD